jgi:hypothetical protein
MESRAQISQSLIGNGRGFFYLAVILQMQDTHRWVRSTERWLNPWRKFQSPGLNHRGFSFSWLTTKFHFWKKGS